MDKAIEAIEYRLNQLRLLVAVKGMPQSILDDTQSRIDELETLLDHIRS